MVQGQVKAVIHYKFLRAVGHVQDGFIKVQGVSKANIIQFSSPDGGRESTGPGTV